MKKIGCRKGCGACCIVLPISSPIPGMPRGKPAGLRCIHLSPENTCDIYESPSRPQPCRSFQASAEFCGSSRLEAMERLGRLQIRLTEPMGP